MHRLLYGTEYRPRIVYWWLAEDRQQAGAGVFGIDIDGTALDSLPGEFSGSEPEAAVDLDLM